MDDQQKIENSRRRKAENFRLNLEEDGESRQAGAEYPETVISSYSDPQKTGQAKDKYAKMLPAKRSRLAHKLRDKEKRRKNRRVFRLVWLVMVVLVSLLMGQYMVEGVNDMLGAGKSATAATVDIPQGATSDDLAQLLYNAGAIRDINFFKLFSLLTKAPKTYGGGSFQITTDMDYEALIHAVQTNKNRVDTVQVTFREGINAQEAAALLEEKGVCSAADATAVINSTDFDQSYDMLQAITNSSDRYYRLEGYLFPDTYTFYQNQDAEDVIRKLVSNCNKKLTTQIRAKAEASGMSLDQVLTLASIIQTEAAGVSDMADISSVFHNRLKSNMQLESDTTVYYPYRTLDSVPENLRGTFSSTYDTYNFTGLPAGPICNPGIDAIEAAISPSSTSNYYFCYDKNNKIYFSKTLAGHQANLKKAGIT